MTRRRRNGDRDQDIRRGAVESQAPPNRVIVVCHMKPGDDGCMPITGHLGRKYTTLVWNGKTTWAGNVAGLLARSEGETFVLEGPWPLSAADIAAKVGISPRLVTHILLCLPAGQGLFHLAANVPTLNHAVQKNGPTGFALGAVEEWSEDDAGKTVFDDLSDKTRRLVAYLESAYRVPVVFYATGYDTVIDTEPETLNHATGTTDSHTDTGTSEVSGGEDLQN